MAPGLRLLPPPSWPLAPRGGGEVGLAPLLLALQMSAKGSSPLAVLQVLNNV